MSRENAFRWSDPMCCVRLKRAVATAGCLSGRFDLQAFRGGRGSLRQQPFSYCISRQVP